jgi:hypothetical protein
MALLFDHTIFDNQKYGTNMIAADTEIICVFEEGTSGTLRRRTTQCRASWSHGVMGSQRKEGTIETRKICIGPNDCCLCDGHFIIGSNDELP